MPQASYFSLIVVNLLFVLLISSHSYRKTLMFRLRLGLVVMREVILLGYQTLPLITQDRLPVLL